MSIDDSFSKSRCNAHPTPTLQHDLSTMMKRPLAQHQRRQLATIYFLTPMKRPPSNKNSFVSTKLSLPKDTERNARNPRNSHLS